MKTTILLILVWLAAVSAHSLRHESSVELSTLKGRESPRNKIKARMLKKNDDDDDTEDDDDTKDSNDKEKDDRKSGGDGDDDPSETKAHRHGGKRSSFCSDIYIVDKDHHCADDVKDAVEGEYEGSDIHMDSDCDKADEEEDVCLEFSDGDDCDKIVEDSLDELDEWCTRIQVKGGGGVETFPTTTAPESPPEKSSPTNCGTTQEETTKSGSIIHMQYHCADLALKEEGNTCVVMYIGHDESGGVRYPEDAGWGNDGWNQGSDTVRVSGGCSDIYLSGVDRCPCSGSIEAAVLDAFGYFAAVHMLEDNAHCTDMDVATCHEMSDSSDCDLAMLSALGDIGSMCGSGTTDDTTTGFNGISQGGDEPTGYTDTTGKSQSSVYHTGGYHK